MSQIVWLSSYPKSGNTFVRFLLANYFFDGISSSAGVDKRIPSIKRVLSHGIQPQAMIGSRVIVKTHFLSTRHPLVKETETAGFIYVVRNPRDVLLSNSRYSGVTGNKPIDTAGFAREFIQHMGVPRWRTENFGSWPEHVASWLSAAPRIPHIFVRYEELKRNTREELTRILLFLGEQPTEIKLERALAYSSLDAMKRMEQKEKATNTMSGVFGDQGMDNYFVGQGNSGQSLEYLGDDIEHEFVARFGGLMTMLGYS